MSSRTFWRSVKTPVILNNNPAKPVVKDLLVVMGLTKPEGTTQNGSFASLRMTGRTRSEAVLRFAGRGILRPRKDFALGLWPSGIVGVMTGPTRSESCFVTRG